MSEAADELHSKTVLNGPCYGYFYYNVEANRKVVSGQFRGVQLDRVRWKAVFVLAVVSILKPSQFPLFAAE